MADTNIDWLYKSEFSPLLVSSIIEHKLESTLLPAKNLSKLPPLEVNPTAAAIAWSGVFYPSDEFWGESRWFEGSLTTGPEFYTYKFKIYNFPILNMLDTYKNDLTRKS
jgi:hypothetical protein